MPMNMFASLTGSKKKTASTKSSLLSTKYNPPNARWYFEEKELHRQVQEDAREYYRNLEQGIK